MFLPSPCPSGRPAPLLSSFRVALLREIPSRLASCRMALYPSMPLNSRFCILSVRPGCPYAQSTASRFKFSSSSRAITSPSARSAGQPYAAAAVSSSLS